MDELLLILRRVLEIAGRLRSVESEIPYFAFILPALLFVFGLMNCILGYRLMRFWMMLIGFAFGVIAAYAAIHYLSIEIPGTSAYIGILLGAGAVAALISFVFYRAGIFLMAFVLGAAASIYLIYPTSSATFYLCLLIGVILGAGALRYDRQVIIITTSLFGGIIAGYSLARILDCGGVTVLLLCLGFVAGGCAVQFWINKVPKQTEMPYVETMNRYGYQSSSARERREKKKAEKSIRRTQAGSGGSNWKGVYKGWEEETEEDKARAQEDFYEEYFHGGDVFDRTSREIRELTGEMEKPDVHVMAWNQKKKRSTRRT